MGAEQSNRQERPRKNRITGQPVVQINRTDSDLQEALEAYATVGLDPTIVERIIQDQEQELVNKQQEQSEVNARQLVTNQLQQERKVNQQQKQQQYEYGEEQLHDKSRQFNETAERVERIFLSKHQPNACVENEQAIIECLAKNPTKVLLCQHLQQPYKECIQRAKQKLIQETVQ